MLVKIIINIQQCKNSKKVESFMEYLEPLFELPAEIRKCIYTSNAVESVNSALRKVTRGKGSFPNENSVYKVMYLIIIKNYILTLKLILTIK